MKIINKFPLGSWWKRTDFYQFSLISTILFFAVFGLGKSSCAGCSWSGYTGTAVSGAQAEVDDCINNNSTGAKTKTGDVTINVPTDVQIWSSAVSIDMNSGWKAGDLTIQGAGTPGTTKAATSGGTTITLNGNVGFVVNAPDAKKWRISNITFEGSTDINTGAITVFGTSKYTSDGGWRIDHITFNNTGRAVTVSGYTYGVIDHNTRPGGGQVFNVSEGLATPGNISWNRADSMGTADAVYFEDNDVECGANCDSPVMFCDTTDGARIVVRHNIIAHHYLGGHDAVVNRSNFSIEAYENDLYLTYGMDHDFATLRGGTGVFYNNGSSPN